MLSGKKIQMKNLGQSLLKLPENPLEFIETKCHKYELKEIESGKGKLIACGSNAEIRICNLRNGDVVVVKELFFQDGDIYSIMQQMANHAKVAFIASEIQHPNIVQLRGISYDIQRFGKNIFYLIYEYCNQGNLREFLNLTSNENYQFECKDFKIRMKLLFDAAIGIRKIHQQDIAHRDVKLDNIVVDMKLNQYTAKICDFGEILHLRHRKIVMLSSSNEELSSMRRASFDDYEIESSVCGTPAYHPPEYIDVPTDERRVTTRQEC